MRLFNVKKGMTLIEIIVALAIFGIISIAFLPMFASGFSTIANAGFRTNSTMSVQSYIEDLNSGVFVDNAAIKIYLDSKGYNEVLNYNELITMTPTKYVNYFIKTPIETVANTQGYEVTILVFFKNGKYYSKATTFVIKGGA